MATRDIIIAFIVTFIFVILINESFRAPDKKQNTKETEKGSSYIKQELDKQIDKLKLIKVSFINSK